MITTTLSADSLCKSQVIALGRQMEDNYRQLVFDCSCFGDGITGVTLVHMRSKDTAPYIVETSDTDQLTWTISDTDTAYYGYGKAELRISFADGLAKSITFTTLTVKSITADTTIPDPLQSWYDAMIDYIDEHSVTIDEVDQLVQDYLDTHPIQVPVQSVNSMTGDVVITAADLGAITSESDPVFTASAAYGISSSDITAWNGKYTKPASGIPATDLTSTVQSRLLKTGGTTGQVLAKASGTNYDVAWTTVSGGGAVDSVNGQTGVVVLTASDVGALADTYTAPVSSVNTKTGAVTLTASDVGALSSSTTYVSSFNGNTGAVTYTAPVTSVNGQTGAVSLSIPTGIPNGGTSGQVLTKDSGTDYDVSWQTPSGGGGLSQTQIQALHDLFSVAAYSEDPTTEYLAFCTAFGITVYTVTNTLTHATNSNSAEGAVAGGTYHGTLAADEGYYLDAVTVTMNNVDVTSTAYSAGVISIANVTGNIVITATTKQILWTFTDGYAISKGTSGAIKNKVWRATTSARACGAAPILNNNYTFTVTDSTKYNIVAYDVTSLSQITSDVPSQAVDGYMYQGGTKSISWKTSDSVSSTYVWLSLKKLDNTSFTDAELANGAAAVFTWTTS